MPRVGNLIRVLHPDYAAGILGSIQAQETSGRWLVRLLDNPLENINEPLILSLEESDFEVLDSQSPQS
ncbi:hypothetical protein C7H19_05505 [Aphanothece hegewaldii CCALA 016]|uniref:DUF3104 domain-containing protein n=1 Tax=Aphanothece hegewaldii CCALA 016 TaxID=2107694 RepID=A0A2T1M185_9CHRO|nr:hypothetical protein [Aphanothece hegewaldii]PSF38441.1 hypothetical protein C7H19_05505 [Aphanothece hegewaldii CCALA 016]